VQTLDVDRWGEYALVIAYLDEVDGGLASMQAAVFAAAETRLGICWWKRRQCAAGRVHARVR